jgi:hypothetical protein
MRSAAGLTGSMRCAGLMVAPPSSAVPPATCGVNLAASQITVAAQHLAPYPGTDWRWSTDPRMVEGNFNPCATLSTALVTVEGATGSSPVAALMFHNGDYLGTATSKAYGFTSLKTARSTDGTVVLDYQDARCVQHVPTRRRDQCVLSVAGGACRHARSAASGVTRRYDSEGFRKTYSATIFPSRTNRTSKPVYSGSSPFGPDPHARIPAFSSTWGSPRWV